MSRIGRMPIAVPAGVTVDIAENNKVTVKGPKGELTRVLPEAMDIKKDGEEIVVTRPNDLKKNKALHGLTRTLIYNMVIGVTAKHDTVDVPASKMKIAIAEILLNEGYIKKYEVLDEENFKNIRITLKYGKDKNEKVITGIKKISKPGLRVYAGKDELPRVLGGLGVAIISTNKGVITDKEARKANVGGEVLAFVW